MESTMLDVSDHKNSPAEAPIRSTLGSLVQAILNEKNSPEILFFRSDLVYDLQQRVEKQDEVVLDLDRSHEHDLKRLVFSLELKRIRFLLRLYLRTRLCKLEAQAAHVLGDTALLERLGPLEQQYTHSFFVLAGTHLKKSSLNHMPPEFQSVVKMHETMSEGNDLVSPPPLDTHVFCNVIQDVGNIKLGKKEALDMKAGDLFMVRYDLVSPLVQEGKAVLV